ncbi:BclA C-terminal domain-containing protein [Paenibacillus thiaminolyticus]|uniref:BclA C-terminal domain-containing protein n=1 Tax=Paenibacillus thiaminolyticus TaxID=49283 RepID=UPI0013E40B9D|nr:hypothetical protein [Paenibacillus thiaminolyticus]MCY9656350.1 hypothetical protein [Paenibacillus thiaminolyticus]
MTGVTGATGPTGVTGVTGTTGATGPSISTLAAFGSFSLNTSITGTLTIPVGGNIPFNQNPVPPVGIIHPSGSDTFTITVAGTYLIIYGIHYTVASAAQLPVNTIIFSGGFGRSDTTLKSGTTSSLDAWMTNSSMLPLAVGDTVVIKNDGTNSFNLTAVPGAAAYITFTRVGP